MDLLNQPVARGGDRPRLPPAHGDLPNLAAIVLKSFHCRRSLEVEIVHFFNKETTRLQELLVERSRAVAITMTYCEEPDPIIPMIEFIRRHNPETKIIVGGPFIFDVCFPAGTNPRRRRRETDRPRHLSRAARDGSIVAERESLPLQTVAGDMADLGMFGDESFDLIFLPGANSYISDILHLWRDIALEFWHTLAADLAPLGFRLDLDVSNYNEGCAWRTNISKVCRRAF